MTAPQYRIAGLSAYPDEFKNFMEPLLIGAKQVGHQVFGLVIGPRSERLMVESLRQRKPDFCLLTGRTVGGLSAYAPILIKVLREEGIPLVFLWYDNPLRYTRVIRQVYTDNVLFITSVDSQCVREMHTLGFRRLVYSPVFVGPAFRPLPPREDLKCQLSFCGGYMTRNYLQSTYIPRNYQIRSLDFCRPISEEGPDGQIYRTAIEGFVEARRRSKHYVDVYDYLRTRTQLQPCTKQFDVCSNLLMHYQKTLEREHLFDAIMEMPDVDLHVYGGADVSLADRDTMPTNWERVRFFPSLDRNSAFPALFPSSAINVGLSQFACAVHGRYFEAAACGGFMIAEYKADVEMEFEIGKEIVCFRSWDEMRDLIRFYRQHDAERRQIGAQAREGHLKRRTARHRLQALMPAIEQELARFRDTAGAAV
jgi:hypothetical protein